MNAAGADEALVLRIAGEVRVAVPNRIGLMTTYVLLEQESWFEDEIGFLRRRLQPEARIVDVGANYGLYSLPLARVAGPAGRVWSIEPSMRTSSALRTSADLNGFGQMTVLRTALSNRTGTARLKLEENSELNMLTDSAAGGATEDVPLTTLDALALEHGFSDVNFLKLDAEGEEERILAGGVAFLARESPLIMYEIKHAERFNLHLTARLAAAGYASYRLLPGLDLLAPFDPAAAIDAYQLNLFACKPDRAALLEKAGLLARSAAQSNAESAPLANHRAAHDATHTPAERIAALRTADAQLSKACAASEDPYRLCSAARVAWELGQRQRALGLLSRADALCAVVDPGAPREPFLAPGPAFDAIPASRNHAAWLAAAVLDQYIVLSAYSTYFANDTIRELLEGLPSTGFQRAPMERRRQLMRIKVGVQPGPQPAAILATATADNLNPEVWSGD